MNEVLKPMLCKRVKERELMKFTNEWVCEIKIDGSRTLLFIDIPNDYFRVQSRRGTNLTKQFPELKKVTKYLSCKVESVILDGELICSNNKFGTVQGRCHQQNKNKISMLEEYYPAKLVVFDILYLNGNDLTKLPFKERRMILSIIINNSEHIELIPQFKEGFFRTFMRAIDNDFEGVVMKRLNSFYNFNKRDWIKCRKNDTIDLEILGHDKGKSGKALVLITCKGRVCVPNPRDVQFFKEAKPNIVEVRYQEFSKNGICRFPVFERFK